MTDKVPSPKNDYFEFTIDDPRSKLVTSNFAKGRRIVLRGLGAFIQVENGKPLIGYSYPCAGPLCRLVEKNKQATDFTFDYKTRKWQVTGRR